MAITQVGLGFPSGALIYQNTDLAEVKDAIKASSAVLYLIEIDNSLNAAEAEYLKLYNAASGGVTVGTTAPDMVIYIPAAAKFTIAFPAGITFGTALTAACVTGAGTAGTTGPTSNVTVRLVYV